MNYPEAIEYLNTYTETLKKFDLATMQQLCKACNFQFSKLKTIHIAGTNGKGSTAAFVSSILREAAYKVGTYTSPHLLGVRERIKINGELIPEKNFAEIIFWLKNVIDKSQLKPSYFEITTAIAFKYFLDKGVDFVVAEVGLGGRLDATNMLDAEVAAITNISLEHSQILGTTLSAIAREKAGIIKPECVVVTNAKGSAFKTISQTAKKQHARLYKPKFRLLDSNDKFQRFDLEFPGIIRNLRINLLGQHQIENAALAVASVLFLQKRKFPGKAKFTIPEKAIRAGLKKAELQGRLQITKTKSLTIFDVAHNVNCCKILSQSLKIFNFNKLIIVFACLSDKNFSEMVLQFKKFKPFFVFTKPLETDRAIDIPELEKKISETKLRADSYRIIWPVSKAFAEAKSLAGKKDLILVTGSHYTVAEAMLQGNVKTVTGAMPQH